MQDGLEMINYARSVVCGRFPFKRRQIKHLGFFVTLVREPDVPRLDKQRRARGAFGLDTRFARRPHVAFPPLPS
jgi:hypothetical protein